MSIQVNDIVRIELTEHSDDYYYTDMMRKHGDKSFVVLDIEDNGTSHHDINVRYISGGPTFYICSCVLGKARAICPFK